MASPRRLNPNASSRHAKHRIAVHGAVSRANAAVAGIWTRAPVEGVIPRVTEKLIVALFAKQLIPPATPTDHIVSLAAPDRVIPLKPLNDIVGVVAEDDIGTRGAEAEPIGAPIDHAAGGGPPGTARCRQRALEGAGVAGAPCRLHRRHAAGARRAGR